MIPRTGELRLDTDDRISMFPVISVRCLTSTTRCTMNKQQFLSQNYWNKFYTKSDWGQPRQEILEVVKGLQRTFSTKLIRILDLGCGDGRYSIPFAELGATVDCVDFSEEAIQRLNQLAEKKVLTDLLNPRCCNVMEYSIKENFYHFIISSGLFEYLTGSELTRLISDIQAATIVAGMNAFVYLLQHPEAAIVPGEHPHPPGTVENFYHASPKWQVITSRADWKEDLHPIEEGGEPQKHKHYIGRVVAKRLLA
jgi:SAM-dependent methyltransferase